MDPIDSPMACISMKNSHSYPSENLLFKPRIEVIADWSFHGMTTSSYHSLILRIIFRVWKGSLAEDNRPE